MLSAGVPGHAFGKLASDVDNAIAWAADQLPNSTSDIIRGAAQEGKLMLGLQTLGDEKTNRSLIAKFNQRYPFIAVDTNVMHAIELQPTLMAEFNAGSGLHDYFQISSNVKAAVANVEAGAIARFVVSEDAAFPLAAKRSGYWYAWTRSANLAVYRKGALSDEERQLVRTYQGLGDPRFKGRLGMLDISASIALAGFYVLMRDATSDVWDGLAKNQPKLKLNGEPLIDGLLAGEYDVAVMASFGSTVESLKGGAPIEFVCTSPSSRQYSALGIIPAVAPHPNAAKLWADWGASKEGLSLFGALTGNMSPRIDADKSWVEQQPWYFEDTLQSKALDWDDVGHHQKALVSRFRRDFSGA